MADKKKTGKIYKLINSDGLMYVAYTTSSSSLHDRLRKHRRDYDDHTLGCKVYETVFYLFKKGTFDVRIELIEKLEYKNVSELKDRTKHWIHHLGDDVINAFKVYREFDHYVA